MHRCLLVTEILTHIFAYLSFRGSRWPRGGGRTLAALAITCRDFKDPALDALWRKLDDPIFAIIQCLPRDALEIRQEPHSDALIYLRRPLNLHDLAIMKTYTYRVKEIYCCETSHNVDIFRALNLAMSTTSLFPNLRKLEWTDTREEFFPFVRMFLGGPYITSLRIFMQGAPEVARLSLLAYIRSTYPDIKNATFHTDPSQSSHTTNAVSELVCGWHRIEHLQCGSLTDHALAHLTTLPALRTLHITIPDHLDAVIAQRKSFPDISVFPELHDLHLSATFLSTCNTVLEGIQSSFVEKIALSPDTATPADIWQRCIKILSSKLSPLSLRDLILGEDFHFILRSVSLHEFPTGYIITLNTLRPLFLFPNMTTIWLNLACVFHLDNKALEELSLAWPRLESLHILCSAPYRRRSDITLHGLVPLLKNCPNLRYVGIEIDANDADSLTDINACENVQNLAITGVNFGESEIENPLSVAAFLSAIFPNLWDIYAWEADRVPLWDDSEKYRELWMAVVEIMHDGIVL